MVLTPPVTECLFPGKPDGQVVRYIVGSAWEEWWFREGRSPVCVDCSDLGWFSPEARKEVARRMGERMKGETLGS